ncbi:hypothetical protein [Roseobacter sp.]|uniref:hypothetical protein n=1 Tax=Roseobacter sp. TaxID=1907202 RepID=UPI00329870F1
MNNNHGTISMALGSWLVAGAVGALATILLWVLGGWGFIQGVVGGAVIFAVVGAIISWIMTRPLPAPVNMAAAQPVSPPTPPAPVVSATPAASVAPQDDPVEEMQVPVEATPERSDDRPTLLSDTAREGAADDLKLIGGVGPKLEETLNGLGIWHFDQVAGLAKTDIAWVDARLRFKGRIERDDWVGQAKILAAGGETEFSKKKRKR